MDFLALLVQKLRQNKQKLIRRIPTNSLWISCKIWSLSAITWATAMPGSRSRAVLVNRVYLAPQGVPEFSRGVPT